MVLIDTSAWIEALRKKGDAKVRGLVEADFNFLTDKKESKAGLFMIQTI